MPRLTTTDALESQLRISEAKLMRLKKDYEEQASFVDELKEKLKIKRSEILLREISKSGKSFDEVLRLIRL